MDGEGAGGAEVLLVEATRDGWWYSAPLPGGALLCAWMTDADLLARSPLPPGAAWARALDATLHTRARAAGLRRASRVHVRRASTSRLDRAAGAGWVAVGDAATAYDPLSAEGVCKAISSGVRAALAVRAHLGGDGSALAAYAAEVDADFQAYLQERARTYGIETRWPASLFWRRRRAPHPETAPITLDPEALLIAVPRAPTDAFADAEALLPPAAVAWLAGAAAEPAAAHELLARLKGTGLAAVGDRRLIVGLQLLLAGGALRAAGPC
jgi:hypothetical protein